MYESFVKMYKSQLLRLCIDSYKYALWNKR